MFKKRTVFVLGAGASAPYGFSTGVGLLEKVRGATSKRLAELAHLQGESFKCEGLAKALEDNQTYSIDALLERRADLLSVGKRVMASLLIQEERASIGCKVQLHGDWIKWVFNQMIYETNGWKDFGANPLSFITFNYDRLLEYRLWNALTAVYGISREDARTALASIPIIHLHGTIAPLRMSDVMCEVDAISFGAALDPSGAEVTRAIQASEKFIKIIHEGVPTSQEFDRARHVLVEAEQLLCLGFGFAPTNVQRLKLSKLGQPIRRFCSTYGMTESEATNYVRDAFHEGSRAYVNMGQEALELFLRMRTHIVQ